MKTIQHDPSLMFISFCMAFNLNSELEARVEWKQLTEEEKGQFDKMADIYCNLVLEHALKS